MRIKFWRWVCIIKDPHTGICVWKLRIPYIIWLERYLQEPPKPGPPPWLRGEKLRPEVAHDLQVLATIEALAQTLSDERSNGVLEFMQKQFDEIELPEGMSVLSEKLDMHGKQ